MTFLVPVLVVMFLLLANAACVAAEFALVATSRAALEARAAKGSRRAKRLLPFASDGRRQVRLLAATQIGVTVASLGLGMFGERELAGFLRQWFERLGDGAVPDGAAFVGSHALASGIAIFALTGLHIVLGEMVPKVIALERAEQVLMLLAPPLLAFAQLLLPLVAFLQASSRLVLRLLRLQPDRRESLHTAADLQAMIHESQESGLIRGEAGAVARRLFEFGDRTAADVLVPREKLLGLPLGAGPAAIRRLLKESRHTRFLVFEDDVDHLVGQVHVKDLLRRILAGAPLQPTDVRPLPRIAPTTPLEGVISAMRSNRSQMAAVVGPSGKTLGLVTLGDLSDTVVGPILERGSANR